ncbi:2-dehydropantoate 2-reductase [Lentibacillus sp. Marseille-P4043]|uniref:2-dehydropantoate 2-reductase n=1 Tax=Lentibacillus sp. Marseille-P4043 TaxID=2040293 RepID=UPI000D0B73ED|nr:2-dehydropantoate 2-reductase [Lentibacillus sp. Marseille-P4043]
MKIGIIGGGSIGLLLSWYLSGVHEVTIYVRSTQQKKSINEYGISHTQHSVPRTVPALLTEELGQEDCYIVCVKQPQLTNVVPYITKIVSKTPLIFLQNGMAHIDQIKNIAVPVFLGIVEHGAQRLNSCTVAHTGQGLIKLATYNEKREMLKAVVTNLNQPKFPIRMENDWLSMLGEKLVVNAVINPLTALFEVQNGEVIRNPYIVSIAKELCHEASMVLGLPFLEQWKHVLTVAEKTKENVSSMWKDLKENQQTENEAISGFLLNRARQNIPYTSFVYNGIRALERKKGIKD